MIYLNGKFVSANEFKIDCADRGLLLGDGIFETLRVYHGRIFCLQAHYERMLTGAGVLKIPIPFKLVELESILTNLLNRNGLITHNAVLRITLTRGPGLRGLLPPADLKPTIMMTAIPFEAQQKTPVRLHISKLTRRNEKSPLSNIKSLCYLDNVLAKMDAVENNADDALLLNTNGHITSASAANIFIITDNNIVVTPALEEGVLPGIARNMVITICKEKNIPLLEQRVSPNELATAREIFITNSIIEIQAVSHVNNYEINQGLIGAITIKLQDYYSQKTAGD